LQRGSSSAAGGIGANDFVSYAICNMGERVGGEAIGALRFARFAAGVALRIELFAASVAANNSDSGGNLPATWVRGLGS
jgi:hypothetical protein